MIRRFVTNVDPLALAGAAATLEQHGVSVELVADDPTGLHHLDIELPESILEGQIQ